MCGIIGAFGPSAESLAQNMEKALFQIHHRGPDSKGIYIDPAKSLLLGHVRLAILDLTKNGHQPFEVNRNVLVYNGEIYNHKDLRSSFLEYRSGSDTETLARMGSSIHQQMSKFIGMFAGGYWIGEQNELILFRDTLGIKPLLIASLNDGTIVFGSDERAIFALAPMLSREIDLNTLGTYLSFENYSYKESFFKAIKPLQPGEKLTLKINKQGKVELKSEKFKFESSRQLEILPEKLIQIIDQELNDSVRRHLLSDVPIGVYLSGGIDSSLVASMAAKNSSARISGFTGYFEEALEFDESLLSLQVARNAGIDFNKVKITHEDFLNNFDSLVCSLGQPRMGFGSFSQSVVARKVSETHKVILSGHGGDELFWGYPYMDAVQSMLTSKSPSSRASRMFKMFLKWRQIFYESTPMAPTIFERQTLSREFQFGDNKKYWLEELKDYYQNIYMYGLLQVEDKVSMQFSLETRMPIWSQPVQSLANQILPALHMEGAPKQLLRKVARAYLPEEVLSAPKRGFPTPFRLWLKKNIFNFAYESLSRENDVLDLVVSKKERIKMLVNFKKISTITPFDEKRAHQLWMLLCLESWSRQFKVSLS